MLVDYSIPVLFGQTKQMLLKYLLLDSNNLYHQQKTFMSEVNHLLYEHYIDTYKHCQLLRKQNDKKFRRNVFFSNENTFRLS